MWTATGKRLDCTQRGADREPSYAARMPSIVAAGTVIIAVGDEILSGHTLDTNSHLLARLAFAAGRPVRRIEVVGDDLGAIAAAIRRALDEAEVQRVAVCGGIGPTPDDRTFEAVALALDRPLELSTQ